MANSWFPHDSTAHNDQRILVIREKYGWEGYGIFWAVLEAMYETVDARLDTDVLRSLYVRFNVEKKWLEEFIDFCKGINLFIEQDGAIFNERLIRDKERMLEKSEQAREAVSRRKDRRSNKPRSTDVQRTYNGRSTPSLPVLTLQSLGEKNEKIDAEVLKTFFDMAENEQWSEHTYTEAKTKQFYELSKEDKEVVLKKMRVANNAFFSKSESTKKLSKKIYHETVGLIQDRALDRKNFDSKTLAKRQEFSEEENGKRYVDQELGQQPF